MFRGSYLLVDALRVPQSTLVVLCLFQFQTLKTQPKFPQVVPPQEQVPQEKEAVPRNKSQTPAPSSEVRGLKPHQQNGKWRQPLVYVFHIQAAVYGLGGW